jgi:hypothetical protein
MLSMTWNPQKQIAALVIVKVDGTYSYLLALKG